ncbi:hypothetical protein SDC9_104782 [bioreactor metagenome]|uniref:Uncharacterized protein n=1 Tax=bioreactor metagenome TaxID=1076179 RepID=A0A645B474_9ZZZZ
MRHQRKRLEHHRDVLAAQGAQLLVAQGVDVLAIDQDAARGGLDQSVEHAHQCRFAGARQAHDDEDLARLDGEMGVEHADGLAGAGQDVLLAQALLHELQRGIGVVSEYLEHMIDDDLFGHVVGPPGGASLRLEDEQAQVELTPTACLCVHACGHAAAAKARKTERTVNP